MVQDSAAKTLAGFEGLKAVRVSGVNFTDAGLESLLALPNLAELDIRNCRKITPEGIEKITGKGTLRVLKVGGPKIDDAVLAVIGGMKNLTGLSLDNCDITDAGVVKLADLPLVDLTIYQAPNVTDKGLAVLANFSNLKRLTPSRRPDERLRPRRTSPSGEAHLAKPRPVANFRYRTPRSSRNSRTSNPSSSSETAVSDAVVDTLSKLKKLKTLVITQTQVSPAGVEKLEKALPGCTIRSM